MKEKMVVKVLVKQGAVTPGIWTLTGRFARKLIREGRAIEVKQEKKVVETKEEKNIPETKDYSGVPISRLKVDAISTEDLKVIEANDQRVTARRMAKEELAKR